MTTQQNNPPPRRFGARCRSALIVAALPLASLPTAYVADAQEKKIGELQGRVELVNITPEFDGVLQPSREQFVSSQADGIIETITVERGSPIKKGQVLANLESSVEEISVELARQRASMDAALKRERANLEFYARKLVQDEGLFAKGIISDQVLAQSRTDKLLAEATALQAEERLKLAQIEKEYAEKKLAQRTIRSPIDGIVIERLLEPGELATQVRKAELFKVAQIDPLHVEVFLPANMLGKVRVGSKAKVRPEAPIGGTHEAEVSIVDPFLDPVGGTFSVRLTVPNKDNKVQAGLKCRVRFEE